MGKNAKTASDEASGTTSSGHRKTKAALAAGAVACGVAATAAYRRRNAQHGPASARDTRFTSDGGDTPPL